jgi:hypothetical protein
MLLCILASCLGALGPFHDSIPISYEAVNWATPSYEKPGLQEAVLTSPPIRPENPIEIRPRAWDRRWG